MTLNLPHIFSQSLTPTPLPANLPASHRDHVEGPLLPSDPHLISPSTSAPAKV